MDKKTKLAQLRRNVIGKYFESEWREVWFFPEYEEVPGVRGFLGTDPIFFVSINPSFGAYPSKPDLFYYRNLKRRGFKNAHLTDVFKVKCKNDNAKSLPRDKKLMREMKNILKEEIKILRPKLIVGVGSSYEKLYRRIFGDCKIPLVMIPHYAPQFNDAEKRKRFRRTLRTIKEKYNDTIMTKESDRNARR